jgi:hypothetical protein
MSGIYSQTVFVAPPMIDAPHPVRLDVRAVSCPSVLNFGEPVTIAFDP